MKLSGTKFELGPEFAIRNGNDIGLSGAVDVRAFGAIGDISADDTSAIVAAVKFAKENGRGVVYFPRGRYKFTSQIIIDASNIVLVGDGIGASMLFPTMAATDRDETADRCIARASPSRSRAAISRAAASGARSSSSACGSIATTTAGRPARPSRSIDSAASGPPVRAAPTRSARRRRST